MDLNQVALQPAKPSRDFATIAALMSNEETEPTTERSLLDWYQRQLELGIQFSVAVDQDGQVRGFNALYRENLNRERSLGIYLIVGQDFRGCGLGSFLFDDLMVRAAGLEARTLRTRVRDTSEAGIRFATQRGFVQKKHSIEMVFDLSTWDDRHYDEILQAVQTQGFRLTDMQELGDTQANRRKLYTLNSSAAATDPGSDGFSPWASFEEFENSVCNTYWYHPDGQIVAVDSSNGEWAAMSAITVFAGADHAYNLFTGTDVRYRNRKLAQAVKTLALRKARTFGVGSVRTSHNSENMVMIAIDTKLGYKFTPGTFTMEKEIVHG